MPLTPRPAAGAVWPILCAALTTLECGRGPAPITIRLVDTFRPELVLGRSPAGGVGGRPGRGGACRP